MNVLMLKSPTGSLVPSSPEEQDQLKRFKAGSVIRCHISEMRNGKFHRKGMTLLHLCYDRFKENVEPAEYNGRQAAACFETYRKNFVVMAGHYDVVFDFYGNAVPEAHSLSFARCTESEFEVIYSSLIDCALKHAYGEGMSEDALRELVDRILAYA
jgi:hypothetical protein